MNRSVSERGLRGRRSVRQSARRAFAVLALAVSLATLVAACGGRASPIASSAPPSATASASPSASGSAAAPSASSVASATTADCASAGLHVTGGPWGGAAGSRGADVVVENSGSADCGLPAHPVVTVDNPAGTVLVRSGPTPTSGGPTIGPTGTVTFSLLLGNWCDRTVKLPLHVELVLVSGSVKVDNLTAASFDDLPPCNGPGQPPSLSATDWIAR